MGRHYSLNLRSGLSHLSIRKFFWVLLGSTFVSILIFFVWLVAETLGLKTALEEKNLTAASLHAQRITPAVHTLSQLSNNNSLETFHSGLLVIKNIERTATSGKQFAQEYAQGGTPSVLPVRDALIQLEESFQYFTETVKQSSYASKEVHSYFTDAELEKIKLMIETSVKTLNSVSIGDARWLVLFQNDDELRATGGFLGSYGLLVFHEGKLADVVIEDVYDADGQFSGFIESPPGHYEYLSSARGLRLPDANWFIDFPTSAATILRYFAYSDHSGIVGVTAITSGYVQELLAIVGPVEIPDYAASVSADTLPNLLRENRGDFFAGSIQKKHILKQLFSSLTFAVTALSQTKVEQVLAVTMDNSMKNNILFYSTKPELQELYTELQVAGSVPDEPFISVNESNVGINKVNAHITREINLQKTDSGCRLLLRLTNSAPIYASTPLGSLTSSPPSNGQNLSGYVVYTRLISSRDVSVTDIQYSRHEPRTFSQNTGSTISGIAFNEIGFLLTLPAQTSEELSFILNSENTSFLQFLKQPGIPQIPVIGDDFDQTQHKYFDKNSVLNLTTCQIM